MSGPDSVLGLSIDVPVWLGSIPLASQALRTIEEGEGVVGRLGAFVTGRRGVKVRAALLYTEILYNVGMLVIIQQARPPQIMASTQVWESALRDPRWFTGVLRPTEVAVVAGPYFHLASVGKLFMNDPITLLAARFTGADQAAVDSLAQMFRDAELVMRKHFNRKTRKRLAKLMSDQQMNESPPRQPVKARVRGTIASVPPSYWFRALQAYMAANIIEGWLKRADVIPTTPRRFLKGWRRRSTAHAAVVPVDPTAGS